MKKTFCILALCLALVSCAGDTQNSSDEAVTTTTTTTATTEASSSSSVENSKPDDSPKPKPAEKMVISAEVLSYKKGIMTFKYEDKEYSLPFLRKNFDDLYLSYYPCLSESIINNKYGEIVNAKLSVNKDISEIFKCDVVTPNVKQYVGESELKKDENGENYIDKDLLYSFKRKEGTLCEIANKNETLEFDLNDLPMNLRLDYPETIDVVMFNAYRFKDGKMILVDFNYNVEIGKNGLLGYGSPEDLESLGGHFCFFGVVQSVGEGGDKITVLLNDKKTLCTVPTYYGDGGELKEGMEIMVRINADETLFGSGGEHEFDYAVIYTEPEYYNQYGEDDNQFARYRGQRTIAFDELAYANVAFNMYFEYTKISGIE